MKDFNKYFIVGTNSDALYDTMNGTVIGALKCGKWLNYCPNVSICSECAYIGPDWFVSKFRYCPNCGARMVEE